MLNCFHIANAMLLYVNSSQASENSTQLKGSKRYSHGYGQSRNHAFSATRFKDVLAKIYFHLSLRVRSYHRSRLELDHISLREVTIHRKSVSKLKKPKLYPGKTYLAENRKTKVSSFLLWSTITLIYLSYTLNRHCVPRFSQRGQLFPLTEDPKT